MMGFPDDIPDGATVELRLLGTPYPAVNFDDVGRLVRWETVTVSAEEAREIRDMIPSRSISEDDVEVKIDGGGSLADVVGDATAGDIVEAGIETIDEAKAATDEELAAINGVGDATIDKIRSY